MALRQRWEFDGGDLVQRLFYVRDGGGDGALLESVPGRTFDVWRETSAVDAGQYTAAE